MLNRPVEQKHRIETLYLFTKKKKKHFYYANIQRNVSDKQIIK